MSRYVNRSTIILIILIGLVGVTALLNTDFSKLGEGVTDVLPSRPDGVLSAWWEPIWEWITEHYHITIGIVIILIFPAARQLMVSTIIYVAPVAIVLVLLYLLLSHEDANAVVYNGTNAFFEWLFQPFLPENYDR